MVKSSFVKLNFQKTEGKKLVEKKARLVSLTFWLYVIDYITQTGTGHTTHYYCLIVKALS